MKTDLSVVVVASVLAVSCSQQPASSSPAPVSSVPPAATVSTGTVTGGTSAGGGQAVTGAPGAMPQLTPAEMAARNDSLQRDRTMHVNEVLAKIAGKEQLPAEQVFKNIKSMKGVPAGRLVAIMNRGYSNSLGVSCSHCHVVGEYDSESKATKQVARDMMAMTATINDDLLRKIPNLRSQNPTVNCGTCHNGRARPGAGGGGAQGQPRPPG